MISLETDRLILRPFQPDDLPAFAAINADPKVMTYFPAPYTLTETKAALDTWAFKWQRDGVGFSAMILKQTGELIGMNGLSYPDFPAGHFLCGQVEIGWRLAVKHWRCGLASEAARAWLNYGFEQKNLEAIGSFASAGNLASLAVMRRIGMRHLDSRTFHHPALAPDSALQPMHYYQIDRPCH